MRRQAATADTILYLTAMQELMGEGGGEAGTCPSCRMPFDKGKKRKKLIDACGHERCFSCMFKSDECPTCETERMSLGVTASPRPTRLHLRSGGGGDGGAGGGGGGGGGQRPKLMTNGHFTPYMQARSAETTPETPEHKSPSPPQLLLHYSSRPSIITST
ncbi:PREDICTED: uncharacterized protein LOC106819346 [Priapulus caudatus]|uniref:Uncharacterized protein LOC106819346 n=1 Tax=Priapulus caudatus TaxID=37621 RepID=A0ABM1F4V7_PRICU|nr:PREDICTED: uncharacterized protein LOC106819346 [Priapulus caudatus]